MVKLYTTKSGSGVLGVKQDTLKHYAMKFGIGLQPGGEFTPYVFTLENLLEIRSRTKMYRREANEILEDREELELGPMYNPDASPRS